MKVLIVCPSSRPATGNVSTVQRIKCHLDSAGIPCLLQDMETLARMSDGCTRKMIHQIVVEREITGILLLHAFKCANAVLCKCTGGKCHQLPVPFGFIFGGTDINVDNEDDRKRSVMKNALFSAMFAVAFTESMAQSARTMKPFLEILVQPQAVRIPKCGFIDIPSKRSKLCLCSYPHLFLMVSGMRPVKDPTFLLESWMEFCSNHKELCLKLLIIGPVLDNEYMARFNGLISDLKARYSFDTRASEKNKDYDSICTWLHDENSFPILHATPLPNEAYKFLLSTQVFATVNSSRSEGMSSAILESMALRVPVIAKAIPGNCAVITESQTGLLYDTPDKFIEQVQRLFYEPRLRDHVIRTAFEYVSTHHSLQREKQFYIETCMQYFC